MGVAGTGQQFITGFVEQGRLVHRHAANQLTLANSRLFQNVRPREFLGLKGKLRTNVEMMNKHWNFLVRFFKLAILVPDDFGIRVQRMRWLVFAGEELFKSQDFSTLAAVVSAMGCTDIHRLKTMWKAIPEDIIEKRNNLRDIFKQTGRFKRLRELHDSAPTPAIPHIGILLGQLTLIDESAKLKAKSKWKYDHTRAKQATNQVKKWTIHQQMGFSYEDDTGFLNLITSLKGDIDPMMNKEVEKYLAKLSDVAKQADKDYAEEQANAGIFSKFRGSMSNLYSSMRSDSDGSVRSRTNF